MKKIYPALPTFIFGDAVSTMNSIFGKAEAKIAPPDHISTEYLIITDLERFVKNKKIISGDVVEFVNHNDVKLLRFAGIKRNSFIFTEQNVLTKENNEYNLKQLANVGFSPRAVIKPILNFG